MNIRRPLSDLLAILSVCASATAVADQHECTADADEVARRRAEQSVLLLERLVSDPERTRQVTVSGNPNALQALDAAQAAVSRVHDDLARGCNGTAAKLAVDGINKVSEAFRLARNEIPGRADEFNAVQERAESFLAALEAQPGDVRGVSPDDIVGMRTQLERARSMAVDGNYSGASALLIPVADRLERRLIAIFDQRTIVYRREFASLEEEYEYLSEQYRGYELLLNQLEGERSLPYSVRAGYNTARQEAGRLKENARQLAADGNWQAAISTATESLSSCERALRLLGVRY